MDDEIFGFESGLSGNAVNGDDRLHLSRRRCPNLVRQALVIDGEVERVRDVVLAGELLREDEGAVGQLLAFIDLESLVGQFRADRASQGTVLGGLVLVDHADDAATCLLCHPHQPFGHVVCQLSVVDVVHQVTHTV